MRANERVSVAMILPSGIDARKNDSLLLQVSDCGEWLNVKIKVDVSLIDVYQTYHAYLTRKPYKIHAMALDYHGKICAHRRIVSEMFNEVLGKEIWDQHNIYLGKVCRRTLAQPSDGDTIFYGTTSVGPRKNGTMLFHVELVVEEVAKRLTKRLKVGKAVGWYKHEEVDGDKVEVIEEEEDIARDRNLLNDDSSSSSEEEEESDEDNENTSTLARGKQKQIEKQNDRPTTTMTTRRKKNPPQNTQETNNDNDNTTAA